MLHGADRVRPVVQLGQVGTCVVDPTMARNRTDMDFGHRLRLHGRQGLDTEASTVLEVQEIVLNSGFEGNILFGGSWGHAGNHPLKCSLSSIASQSRFTTSTPIAGVDTVAAADSWKSERRDK